MANSKPYILTPSVYIFQNYLKLIELCEKKRRNSGSLAFSSFMYLFAGYADPVQGSL